MKASLSSIVWICLIGSALAGLGHSPEEYERGMGAPLKKDGSVYIYSLAKGQVWAKMIFFNNKSITITFSRGDLDSSEGFTEPEINELLIANSDGKDWKKVSSDLKELRWETADDVAIYKTPNGQSDGGKLYIQSKNP
jgi:hypothetical protein